MTSELSESGVWSRSSQLCLLGCSSDTGLSPLLLQSTTSSATYTTHMKVQRATASFLRSSTVSAYFERGAEVELDTVSVVVLADLDFFSSI